MRRSGGNAGAARSYHCHAVILAGHSGYFKAQLSSTWLQPPTPPEDPPGACSTAVRKLVDIHVQAEELAALHEVLLMMYSQALSPAAAPSQPLFLHCLRLADRLESDCMELLLAGLAAVDPEAITYEMAHPLFQIMPGACASPSYRAALTACGTALLRLFGDAPAIAQDKAQLQRFCALPHAAVLAWVKSDELRVDSENCVIFLVSAWVKANQDSTATQHEELAHQVRVFHLGPAYLHHILPNLSWFKGCSSMQHLPVLSCIRAGVEAKNGLPERSEMWSGLQCAPAWRSKCRGCTSSLRTHNWVLSLNQLRAVDDGRTFNLPPAYANGFLLQLGVKAASGPAPAGGKTLRVFRGFNRAAMEQLGVPLPGNAVASVGTISVKVGSAGSRECRTRGIGAQPVMSVNYTQGCYNVLRSSGPTFLELVAPYLEEEQLHIEAKFWPLTAVDSTGK